MTTPTAVVSPSAEQIAASTDAIAEIMNHGWLVLGMSIGEHLGLFEIAGDGVYRSVPELAEASRCDRRYLQEWAWAMCAEGLLEVRGNDGGEPLFRVRPSFVPALTAAGGPQHWSRITTQIAALAQLEGPLLEAMRTGAGLSGDLYEGDIVEALTSESAPIFAKALHDEVIPVLGIAPALTAGIRMLDVGCGTGDALISLATAYPASTFLGVDQSPDAVAVARVRADGLANVAFEVMDVEDGLPDGPFGLIMAANLAHDLSDPARFFRAAHAALAPGGTFYLHELSANADMEENIANPHAVGILMFSLFHCVPLARRRDGIAPGGMWGREHYIDSLREAGFSGVSVFNAPSDPNNDTIYATA